MSLARCQPNRNVVPFSMAMNRVFDEFFPGFYTHLDSRAAVARPSVDVVEEEDRMVLKADLPGMEKKDIKVIVHDGLLSIEGSRNDVHEENGRGFTRSERTMGTFTRSFNLPGWADGSKLTADYKNGVLTVTIPKSENARPKEVEIQVG